MKAALELGVSAHYVGIWKRVFGEDLVEGHVGLMGVLSSALMIFEAYINTIKQE